MKRLVGTALNRSAAMSFALIVCLFIAQSALAVRWYVNIDAPPGGDGETWGTAFNDLHDALDNFLLQAGDEIWVAAGTYIPTKPTAVPNLSGNAFDLREEVRLYGGFAGNETSLSQRQIVNDEFVNETILTNEGFVLAAYNIGGGGDDFPGTRTVVNGFTIRDSGDRAVFLVQAAPVFIRCRFIANNVAVVADGNFEPEGANRGVEFINCHFIGGGLAADGAPYKSAGVDLMVGADGVFTHCLFADNVSDVTGGAGAVWVGQESTADFYGCRLFRNTSLTSAPGGIFVGPDSEVRIKNSIFWANRHGKDGDIGGESAQILVLPGGIISLDYSLVEGLTGAFGGTGNIDDDPLFISETTPDLRLQGGSPAIDSGRNGYVPGDRYNIADNMFYQPTLPTPDLDIARRIVNGIVDMGPYEYVPEGDLTGSGTVGWEDMDVLLANYGCVGDCVGDFNLDEEVDGEDVATLLELMEDE